MPSHRACLSSQYAPYINGQIQQRGSRQQQTQDQNQKGDERERTIRMEGESFSLLFVFLMGLILLTWKRVHGLPHEDVLTMFWTACVANRVYRLARRRNTSDIVTLLISLAFLSWNLVKFFQMA